jgi:hypothetical protein
MQHISEEHPSQHGDMTGDAVRVIRQRLQMSQRGLARLFGMHPVSLWRIEHNRRRVSPRFAVRLLILAHRLKPLARHVCPRCKGTGLLDGNNRHILGIPERATREER